MSDEARTIEAHLSEWQQQHPPGSDYTGEGHEAPSAWAYDFWRLCNFRDDQLSKVQPTLGQRCLSMEWDIYDGEYVSRAHSYRIPADESSDHPRRWHYSMEFGDEEDLSHEAIYLWRTNTSGIPVRHWEPVEGGRYKHGDIAGEWVDHPQPSWAVNEGLLLHDPTPEQVHHFVDTGEFPALYAGQRMELS